jgi:hypothetical protein
MKPTVTKLGEPDLDVMQEHIFSTYITLRRGLALIAFLFPLFIIGIGLIDEVARVPGSFSAYYWESGTGRYLPRIAFVGLIFALASGLYLYKGFTKRENIVLNVAAILAVVVAFFPTGTAGHPGASTSFLGFTISVHGASAVAMFLLLAYVVFFLKGDTLRYLPPAYRNREQSFRRAYSLIALAMGVAPVAAFVLNETLGGGSRFVLLAEWVALAAFGTYWWTKGKELKLSNATRRGLLMGSEAEALRLTKESKDSAGVKREKKGVLSLAEDVETDLGNLGTLKTNTA